MHSVTEILVSSADEDEEDELNRSFKDLKALGSTESQDCYKCLDRLVCLSRDELCLKNFFQAPRMKML
jgi:hypothetical protein